MHEQKLLARTDPEQAETKDGVGTVLEHKARIREGIVVVMVVVVAVNVVASGWRLANLVHGKITSVGHLRFGQFK